MAMTARWAPLVALAFAALAAATDYDYLAVIDAGSTGSRIYVYKWEQRIFDSLPALVNAKKRTSGPDLGSVRGMRLVAGSAKVSPGIATFAYNYTGLEAYLETMTEWAEGRLGAAVASSTRLYLFATGGVRDLPPAVAAALMAQVELHLREDSGFDVGADQVEIITGETEAIFSWVSVNYLYGVTEPPTWNVLDMGGAATQIAYEATTDVAVPVQLAYLQPWLWGDSYQDFGQDTMWEEILRTGSALQPCLLVGYSETYAGSPRAGTGNASQCYAQLRAILNVTAGCPTCSIDGEFLPPPPNNTAGWFAYKAFQYTSDFFGLTTYTLAQLKQHGDAFCATSWAAAQAQHPGTALNFLKVYCFTAQYFVALMHEAYHLPMGTQITSLGSINGVSPTYAHGAAVYLAGTADYVHIPIPEHFVSFYPAESMIPPGDDNEVYVELPGQVNFLGTLYDRVTIGTNGYIALGATGWSDLFEDLELPLTVGDRYPVLLPFYWDAETFEWDNNGRFIDFVSYSEVEDNESLALVESILGAVHAEPVNLSADGSFVCQATWYGVGHYMPDELWMESLDQLNTFQTVLVATQDASFLIVTYADIEFNSSFHLTGIDAGDTYHYMASPDWLRQPGWQQRLLEDGNAFPNTYVFRLDTEFAECGDGRVGGIEECDSAFASCSPACTCPPPSCPDCEPLIADGNGGCAPVSEALTPLPFCPGAGYARCTGDLGVVCHWCSESEGCASNWAGDGAPMVVDGSDFWSMLVVRLSTTDGTPGAHFGVEVLSDTGAHMFFVGAATGVSSSEAAADPENDTEHIACLWVENTTDNCVPIDAEIRANTTYLWNIQFFKNQTVFYMMPLDDPLVLPPLPQFVELSGQALAYGRAAGEGTHLSWTGLVRQPLPLTSSDVCSSTIETCDGAVVTDSPVAFDTPHLCQGDLNASTLHAALRAIEAVTIDSLCFTIDVETAVMPLEGPVVIEVAVYDPDEDGLPGERVYFDTYDVSLYVRNPGPITITLDKPPTITSDSEDIDPWSLERGMYIGIGWTDSCPRLSLNIPTSKKRSLAAFYILDPATTSWTPSTWTPSFSPSASCPVRRVDPHRAIDWPAEIEVDFTPAGNFEVYVILPDVTLPDTRAIHSAPRFVNSTGGDTGVSFPAAAIQQCSQEWSGTFFMTDLIEHAEPVVEHIGANWHLTFRVGLSWTETFPFGLEGQTAVVNASREVDTTVAFAIIVPQTIEVSANISIASSRVLWAYVYRGFVHVDAHGIPSFELQIRTLPVEPGLIILPGTMHVLTANGNVANITDAELLTSTSDGATQLWSFWVTMAHPSICTPTRLDNFTLQFTLGARNMSEIPWSPAQHSLPFELTIMENWCAVDSGVNITLFAAQSTYTSARWERSTRRYLQNSPVYADISVPPQKGIIPSLAEVVGVTVESQTLTWLLWNGTDATPEGVALRFQKLSPCLAPEHECYTFLLDQTWFGAGEVVTLHSDVLLHLQEGKRKSSRAISVRVQKVHTQSVIFVAPKELDADDKGEIDEAQPTIEYQYRFASPSMVAAIAVMAAVPFLAVVAALVVLHRKRH
eukprot:m51a1_g7678 hypothetical protein (1565) ;mRNA; r:1415-7138